MSTQSIDDVFGPEHDHRCGDRLPKKQRGCGRWYKHQHRGIVPPKPNHGERVGQCPYEDCEQYSPDCDLPTKYSILVTRRGCRGGVRIQDARKNAEADTSSECSMESSDKTKASDEIYHWLQQRTYGRNRTTNLRTGLYTQAIQHLRDTFPRLSTRDISDVLNPVMDQAFIESTGEIYFADSMNVPGVAASIMRASAAATKGEFVSQRPAGALRAVGALLISTGGTMLTALMALKATKLVDGIPSKIGVGALVAVVGVTASNLLASSIIKPVKVKMTLPGL